MRQPPHAPHQATRPCLPLPAVASLLSRGKWESFYLLGVHPELRAHQEHCKVNMHDLGSGCHPGDPHNPGGGGHCAVAGGKLPLSQCAPEEGGLFTDPSLILEVLS